MGPEDDDEDIAGIAEIRDALVERLGSIPEFDARSFWPDSINVPGAWVEPDRPFVDYEQVFDSDHAEWKLVLTIVTSRIDEDSAQKELDGWLSPRGPFISKLREKNVGDTLDQLVSYVQVLTGSRYGAYRVGDADYLGAQVFICVWA